MGSLIMIAFLYFVPLILFGLRFRWAWPEVTAHARQYLGWHLFWGWLWLFGGPCVILHFRLRSLLRGSLS